MANCIPYSKSFPLPSAWSSYGGNSNAVAIYTDQPQSPGNTVIIPNDFHDGEIFILANDGTIPINFSAQGGVLRDVGVAGDASILTLQPQVTTIIFRRSGDVSPSGAQINYMCFLPMQDSIERGPFYLNGDANTDGSFRWIYDTDSQGAPSAGLQTRVNGTWKKILEANMGGTMVAKSITTGLNSFDLGQNHSLSSGGEEFVVVNNYSKTAWIPLWQSMSQDGLTPGGALYRQHGDLADYEPSPGQGTGTVEGDDITTFPTNAVLFSAQIVPMEDYTGVLNAIIKHWDSVHGETIAICDSECQVVMQKGIAFKFSHNVPVWTLKGESYKFHFIKQDGTPLQLANSTSNPLRPWRKIRYRPFVDLPIGALSNVMPLQNGTASPGVAIESSRADHTHPMQAIDMHLPGAVQATDLDPGLTVVDASGATLPFSTDRTTIPGRTVLKVASACAGNIFLPQQVEFYDCLMVAAGSGGGAGDIDSSAGSGGGGAGGDVMPLISVPNLQGKPIPFAVGKHGIGGVANSHQPQNGTLGGATTLRGTTVLPGGAGGGNADIPAGTRDGVTGGGGPGAGNQRGGAGSKYYSGGNGGGEAGGGGSSCNGRGASGSDTLPGFGGKGVNGMVSKITGIPVVYGSSAGGAAGFIVGGGTTAGGKGGIGAGDGDTCTGAAVPGQGGTPGTNGLGAGGGGSCGGNNGYDGGDGCVVLVFDTVTRNYWRLLQFNNDQLARAGGIDIGEYYTDLSGVVHMRLS